MGEVFEVAFRPVEGTDLNKKIDAAYSEKYSGSPYLKAMVNAKEATVQVLPLT